MRTPATVHALAVLFTLGLVAAPAGLAMQPPAERGATTSGKRMSPLLPPGSPDVQAADAATFRERNAKLASPEFEGRAPGTKGNQLAADLLEAHYKGLGLVPAFAQESAGGEGAVVSPNTSYRQPFQLGSNSRVTDQSVSWESAAGTKETLAVGTDYNVLSFSGTADCTGPLAFAGYGINVGQDGYSSFGDDTDFTGKVVLVMRFEPMNDEGKTKWGKERWSYMSQLESKISAVVKRKAAGVILVNPPGADDERTAKLETFDSIRAMTGPAKVPVVMMSTERVDALVKAADPTGRSLMDLRKIADEKGGTFDLPNATVTLKTAVERSPIMTSNVGAILKGRGELADEYVVLGAHYDHIGFGRFGSRDPAGNGKLHPGADDNASGTAGLMVLADKLSKAYATMPADEPARSILFLSFTGEESGLNGSRHYTQHMIADKSKHYLMINLDMIGRLREQPPLEVSGVGTAEGLEDFVRPYLDSFGMKTISKPSGGGPSDHASFNAAGIPVLFFFTGLHEQYHMPTDTPDTIDAAGAAKVIDLASRLALAAATRDGAFPYSTDQKAKETESPGPVAVGVRFGITPGSYGEETGGVLVDDVAKGWSADKAGIKKGDRIMRWNGQDVPNVESWMPFLGACKPGDLVKVTVLRDGKEVPIDVIMMARDNGPK